MLSETGSGESGGIEVLRERFADDGVGRLSIFDGTLVDGIEQIFGHGLDPVEVRVGLGRTARQVGAGFRRSVKGMTKDASSPAGEGALTSRCCVASGDELVGEAVLDTTRRPSTGRLVNRPRTVKHPLLSARRGRPPAGVGRTGVTRHAECGTAAVVVPGDRRTGNSTVTSIGTRCR